MKQQTDNRRGAFTLLEVLVSFVLLMLIISVGALSLSAQSNKKKLVEPATELKVYARKALQLAINNRRSFGVHLTVRGFTLREAFVKNKEDEDTFSQFAPLFDEPEESDIEPVLESYELDDDMRLEVRRWGEKHFREPEEHDTWIFEPSGICEPLAIKLISPDGKVEMEFNPLTAKIADQSLVLGAEYIDDF